MSAYRNVLAGLIGGAVGTLAMGQYWTRVAPLVEGRSEEGGDQQKEPKKDEHSISVIGQQHQPGESSTAAIGRVAYEKTEGHAPGRQTRAALSEAVHWGMGIGSGALYGALAGRGNPVKGAAFGVGLWALVDEGIVPLLGLQDGPAATPAKGHTNRLGAHLTYGLALGVTALLIDALLPED
ncbi:DUF1440 domain-containing protein [Deinococcus xianganensis]|uniref:DUF1440 domain-containing protein n=1 Tax=Deinococcus xianganensis TaxID=1507289 RepID=A0A6I4YCX7_9DEIO|nr:DUF1440 domain-containing protein [Deinococcus xianganensis]MXV18828.1 hypothetical protein [Deinococcus xianganensis]